MSDKRRRGPSEGTQRWHLPAKADWLRKWPQREQGQRARLTINHPRDMQKLCGPPSLTLTVIPPKIISNFKTPLHGSCKLEIRCAQVLYTN